MSKGLIGKKVGMTTVFVADGNAVPVTVVEVHRVHGIGEGLLARADDALEHRDTGVLPRSLGELDDEWCLCLQVTAEEAERLLHVVDVVRPGRELPIRVRIECLRRDDHRGASPLSPARKMSESLNAQHVRAGRLSAIVWVGGTARTGS